jgi:hypothetical protein
MKKERKKTFTRCKSYCESVVLPKGTITRIYRYYLNSSHGLGGLLYGGSSIQGVCREIRGLLMKHTTNIDMKNAHLKILLH